MYNEDNPNMPIEQGDYIVAVNEASNNARDIVTELKKKQELNLSIQKSCKQCFTIPKGSRSLGLDLVCSEAADMCMAIVGINVGAVTSYNALQPASKRVKPYGRVVSLDGFSGSGAEMLDKL